MDNATLIFVISVASAIIGLLLVVVGFFLKKIYDTLTNLGLAVSELMEFMAVAKANYNNLSDNCKNKHQEIATRLNNHGERIKQLEVNIEVIKTKEMQR